jgi:hypothetical protein
MAPRREDLDNFESGRAADPHQPERPGMPAIAERKSAAQQEENGEMLDVMRQARKRAQCRRDECQDQDHDENNHATARARITIEESAVSIILGMDDKIDSTREFPASRIGRLLRTQRALPSSPPPTRSARRCSATAILRLRSSSQDRRS